jgi:hypothetical protein
VAYTPKQLALWDTLADLVRQHSPEDVLDAMSDAFIHFDEPGADIQHMERIGRALERVGSELLSKETANVG